MNTTRSFFTLAAVALLAITGCSTENTEAEPSEASTQSQEQPAAAEATPTVEETETEPIEEFEHSAAGGTGEISEGYIALTGDMIDFLGERDIVADEAALAEFGSERSYGRPATEAEYWAETLSNGQFQGEQDGAIEIVIQPEDIGFDSEPAEVRQAFVDDLLPIVAGSPHLEDLWQVEVVLHASEGVLMVVASWIEEYDGPFES